MFSVFMSWILLLVPRVNTVLGPKVAKDTAVRSGCEAAPAIRMALAR